MSMKSDRKLWEHFQVACYLFNAVRDNYHISQPRYSIFSYHIKFYWTVLIEFNIFVKKEGRLADLAGLGKGSRVMMLGSSYC